MAAPRSRSSSCRTNSSWTSAWTIAVPSDVQRWPAVPNPPNRAPSTASAMSASSMITIGFLPPSSRHGDWRWRPHSAPISAPTADEPVKPTLSTSRCSSARWSPADVCSPSAWTRFSTPLGTPPAWKISVIAEAIPALYSAGFQTTALPHRIAGTRYHEGTAPGKLPAVMMVATPTGTRNVKSCLSGISDGTVCPYSRRPSPRKKSQVSMISCTSPSDSGYGLPISRVTSRASASLLASNSRPTSAITRPRAGAGTAAQSRCAARAARHAASKPCASVSSTSATTSDRLAGLVDSRRPPGASVRAAPSMIDAAVRVEVAVSDMPATLRPRGGEPLLERVDRPHVHGIDAAQHRQVERDEIAEEHEGHEPFEPGVAARRHALDDRGALGRQLGGDLDPPRGALVALGVLEEDRAQPPVGASPADDLVVVVLRQLARER